MNGRMAYNNQPPAQGTGSVLARSMNDPTRVDEIIRQASTKGRTVDLLITGMAVVFIIIGFIARSSEKQQWWTAFSSNRFDQSTMLFGLGGFSLLMGLIVLIPIGKAMRGLNARYDEFRRVCISESLVVESQIIYGMMAGTAFRPAQQYTILIRDLKSVTIRNIEKTIRNVNPFHYDELDLNEVLTITDIKGNILSFSSFSNCVELKSVIERQMMIEKTEGKMNAQGFINDLRGSGNTGRGQGTVPYGEQTRILSDGSWICKKCETKNPPNAAFCKDCGTYKG